MFPALVIAWAATFPANDAAAEPEGRTVTAPDGITIAFDEQGGGEPALVFIHGWNCDRSYWRGQREVFAQSHRVVTLDLAGHGESGHERTNWTMEAMGADVAAVVTALDLSSVVLVGHSMGGKVAVEAARQLADRVTAVVGVDTFHNGGRATPESRQAHILESLSEDYTGYVAQLVDRMFVEQSEPAIRAFVLADMSQAPQQAAIGARRASGSFDATAAIASLQVPLILISSDYMPTDLAYLEKAAGSLTYREMSGVGHFLMLEDPETFNTHLAAVLADIT